MNVTWRITSCNPKGILKIKKKSSEQKNIRHWSKEQMVCKTVFQLDHVTLEASGFWRVGDVNPLQTSHSGSFPQRRGMMINHETDVHGFEHGSRTCMAFLWFGMNHWPAFMQIMVSLGLNIVFHTPKSPVGQSCSVHIGGFLKCGYSENHPSDSGSPSWLSCCWSSITKVKGKLA